MFVQAAAAGAAIKIGSKGAFVVAGLWKYRRVLRWLARFARKLGLKRYAGRILKYTLRHPFRVASFLGTLYGYWKYRKSIAAATIGITSVVVTDPSNVWGYLSNAACELVVGLDYLGGWIIKLFAVFI